MMSQGSRRRERQDKAVATRNRSVRRVCRQRQGLHPSTPKW